jgi:hypothetical protein
MFHSRKASRTVRLKLLGLILPLRGVARRTHDGTLDAGKCEGDKGRMKTLFAIIGICIIG